MYDSEMSTDVSNVWFKFYVFCAFFKKRFFTFIFSFYKLVNVLTKYAFLNVFFGGCVQIQIIRIFFYFIQHQYNTNCFFLILLYYF